MVRETPAGTGRRPETEPRAADDGFELHVRVSTERLREDLRDPLDAGRLYRALTMAMIAGVIVAALVQSAHGFGAGVLAGLVAAVAAFGFVRGLGPMIWGGFSLFVAPSLPPEDDFSLEKALIAQGRIDDVVGAIDVLLDGGRDDLPFLFFAAETFARDAHLPRRAEELFQRIRTLPAAKPGDDFRATMRLLDLYDGALADPALAARELARLRDRHPDTTAGAHAAQALAAGSAAGALPRFAEPPRPD
jgi:hypothetical protein